MTPNDDDLRRINQDFEKAHPGAIVRWAAETFGAGLAVVTSFQPTGIATLHMLREIAPETAVLTLDTGLLFPETQELIDRLEQRFALNLIRVRPGQTVDQQADRYGPELWERDPDLCCRLRKVTPLRQALAAFDGWITGLRRDHSPRRAGTPIVAWDRKHNNVKLCPFANWTERMVWAYLEAHELPYNRLHDHHYPSIGCWPCTRSVDPEIADSRAGRWTQHEKTECGIHFGGL
jgi:phosphoadenosine phosphosulfate reductase